MIDHERLAHTEGGSIRKHPARDGASDLASLGSVGLHTKEIPENLIAGYGGGEDIGARCRTASRYATSMRRSVSVR
jgi:hypothetical protein